MAPPKRGPMVSSPLTRQDTRSLPARDVTIVLCAPAPVEGGGGKTQLFYFYVIFAGPRCLNGVARACAGVGFARVHKRG